jgi:glycosyltransferase involved in cell wall biosynthesis
MSALSMKIFMGRLWGIFGGPPAAKRVYKPDVLRTCALVPALDAAETVAGVVEDLRASLSVPVIVVDDGSADATGELSRAHGAELVRHPRNLGKGAAIRSGLLEAARRGFDVALTVDADGQHPGSSARAVLEASDDRRALVLGVRNLAKDGAPRWNRFGNGVSNFFLSLFAGRLLRDTQCGLRRYPVGETLALGVRALGYAFEAEVVLRAIAAGLPVLEVPVGVVYPAQAARRTHFRRVRDPARIVATVVRTALEIHRGPR